MRKRILPLLLGSMMLAYATEAQMQIFNSDFELWDNVGNDTEEPQGWNGLRTATGSLAGSTPQTIARSTQTRPGSAGNYSVRVYTTSTFGINANGNLTTGRVNAGSITPTNSSNYNFTVTGNTNFSKALTDWPDSLVFWARYNPSNQSSMARVRAVIHDNYNYRDPSDAASASHVVADATLNFTSNNNAWQRISIPFVYSGPATSPAYLLITYTSNMTPGGGNSGDEVFIDDMALIYNPVSTTAGTINPLSYSVSATQSATITVPFTKTGIMHFGNVFTAQLSDANGSFSTPINLGTLSSTSAGTINGVIPAGTPSGSGYRVRVISSTPYIAANTNNADISINLAANSVSPATAQTIAANTAGDTLFVSESMAATSRSWKYANTPNGPYTAFSPNITASSFVPNFTNAGTYYVVCESAFGSLSARSNEVSISVVKNQISPSGTQSLLIGQTGTSLLVNETPMGSSREWKFASASGGPYQSFSPAETGTSFAPNFPMAGLYYVVCQSEINGISALSNEVSFSIGSINLTTGSVSPLQFSFSPSAPNGTVNVPFTVSSPFNSGNTFTAQLSDGNGSFANATSIGSVNDSLGGSITGTIPANTAAGNGYLIRVIASDPAVLGSDNGTPISIDQFSNNISPNQAQTVIYNTPSAALTVQESQAITSREWMYGNLSGGPYQSFSPTATGISFAPSFSAPGNYYVVCVSTNVFGDSVTSNEVAFTVQNGNTLQTGTINNPIFYVSPSAVNTFSVPVNTNILFDSSNVFTVELSNSLGDFSAATQIGNVSGNNPSLITASIPNNTPEGTQYRIRVVASSPAIIGTQNPNDLSVIGFAAAITPIDTQFVNTYMPITPVSVTSTHPFISVRWKFRTAFVGDYTPFNPNKTGIVFAHTFTNPNTYQVIAECVNQWNDTLETEQVVFKVSLSPAGINEEHAESIHVFYAESALRINLEQSGLKNPKLSVYDMTGKRVFEKQVNGEVLNVIPWTPKPGIYVYKIYDGIKFYQNKVYVY